MAIDATLQALTAFAKATPCVLVTLTQTLGSTPRVHGTQMLVSAGEVLGTIGGGQLEYLAIDAARTCLKDKTAVKDFAVPLGPDIGQCCGGHVTFSLAPMTQPLLETLLAGRQLEIDERPSVFVFGAGHVGRALALAFQPLPVNTLLVDNRAEELELADPGIDQRHTPLPETLVRSAPAGSAFVVLTHDHALDFLIASEALKREDAAYVGMIGSKTKRATFVSWLKSETGKDSDLCDTDLKGMDLKSMGLNALVMPIGASKLTDKRPAVIAAMAASEVMEAVGMWHNQNSLRHQTSEPREMKRTSV